MWLYKGEEFTSEMIEEWVGFVYLITDKSNGMKYVGKKDCKYIKISVYKYVFLWYNTYIN